MRIAVIAFLFPSLALAAPTERRVYSNMAHASTYVANDWRAFKELGHPNYALDDDAATAWVESAPANGPGEWLRVDLPPLDKTTKVKLKIRNGCQKSKAMFAENARAKDITVRLLPANVDVKVTLADKDGWQDAEATQPSGALAGVELRIGTVYDGSKTKDLCISDVQVLATSEAPNATAFEAGEQKALAEWRASRAAFAKVKDKKDSVLISSYDSKTVDQKFAGTGFLAMIAAAEQDKIIGMELKYGIVRAKKLVENFATAQKVTWTAKPSELAMPQVDGVQIPTFTESATGDYDTTAFRMPMIAGAAILFRDQMTIVDTKVKQTPDEWAKQTGACTGDAAWVVRGESSEMTKGQIVETMLVAKCAMVTDRSGTAKAMREREIYVFGPEGQVAIVIGEDHVEAYTWGLIHGKPMITAARSLLGATGKLVESKNRDY